MRKLQYMRQALVVATLACLFVEPLRATAIVVLRTATSLVLAADSLVTLGGERQFECKLVQVGPYWVAAAGMYGLENTSFDLFPLLKTVTGSESIDNTVVSINRTLGPQLAIFLEHERRQGPSTFDSFFATRKGLVLALYVAGYERRIPVATRLIFAINAKGDPGYPRVGSYLMSCPGPWCPDGQLFSGAGSMGPISSTLRSPYPDWVVKGDAAAAQRLIREEIQANPAEVGPPIDVLEFGQDGRPRWVNRSEGSRCLAISGT